MRTAELAAPAVSWGASELAGSGPETRSEDLNRLRTEVEFLQVARGPHKFNFASIGCPYMAWRNQPSSPPDEAVPSESIQFNPRIHVTHIHPNIIGCHRHKGLNPGQLKKAAIDQQTCQTGRNTHTYMNF